MSDNQQGAVGGDDFESFFQPNHTAKRRRGFTVFMFVFIGLIVVLAILAVVADIVVRNYAEGRAAKEIESSLPTGTTGTVGVKINGFSVLLQALNGSLDDVTLTSKNLVVQKVPLTFDADIADVPLKSGGTTGAVDATIMVSQDAVNQTKAVSQLGGKVTLGTGDFSFDKGFAVLGKTVTAKITAKPSLSDDGKTLTVTPTDASVGGAALPAYLKPLLATAAQKICTATYVPEKATLTAIHVKPSTLTLDLHSKGLPLTAAGLTKTGTC